MEIANRKKKECQHKKRAEIARTPSSVEAKTTLGSFVDVHYQCLDCGKSFSEPKLEGIPEDVEG